MAEEHFLEKCKKSLHLMKFDHPCPLDFIRAKWNRNADFSINVAVYGLVRIFVGIYMTFWLVWTIILLGPKAMIYLTTWGFMLLCADTHLQGLLVFWYRKNNFKADFKSNTESENEPISIPWLMKLSWVMTSLSSAMALTITFGYWIILYRDLKVTQPLLEDIHLHLINSVYTIGSILVAARPFRWQHIYIPALELVTYLIFCYVYQSAGGTNNLGDTQIYPFMDFSNLPLLFGHCFAILVASLSSHLFVFLINFLVEKLFRKVRRGKKHADSNLSVSVEGTEGTYVKTKSAEDNLAFEAREEQ